MKQIRPESILNFSISCLLSFIIGIEDVVVGTGAVVMSTGRKVKSIKVRLLVPLGII